MIRFLRIVGFLLIVSGALVILSWLFEPLRELWPLVRQLPWPIQLGLVLAGTGLLLLMATLIWERWEERESDRELRD